MKGLRNFRTTRPTTAELESEIKQKIFSLRRRIESGDESQLVECIIEGQLACSQRPLRDCVKFGGGIGKNPPPLPPESRPFVADWARRIKDLGIRSIICLLEPKQLCKHYVRGGLNLHNEGLLGYYREQGFEVKHFPFTDYRRPPDTGMQEVFEAFTQMSKPVLIHCSAAVDRTTPIAAFILHRWLSRADE